MFSGGMPPAKPVSAADRKELSRLADLSGVLQEKRDEKLKHKEIAADGASKAGGEVTYARRRLEEEQGTVRAGKKEFDANKHELDKLKKDLKVSENNSARLFDLAHFQKKIFQDQVISQEIRAKMTAIGDNKRAGLECVRSFHASSSKLNAAIAGNPSPTGRVEPDTTSRLQPTEPIKDTSQETFGQAVTQKSDHDTKVKRHNELAADPYIKNKLAKAETDKSKAEADHAKMEVEEKKTKKSYETMRSEVQIAQKQLQEAGKKDRHIREKYNG